MTDTFLKEFEAALHAVTDHVKQELQMVRSNRPSVQIVENLSVSCYDNQIFPIKQLASITIVPPREIQITAWDKAVVGAITTAIEDARIGLSVSSDGMVIHARLSALGEERRLELMKVIKKAGEAARVAVRNRRDEAMKKIKAAEDSGDARQDEAFRLREKAQKIVDSVNGGIEKAVDDKLAELAE